MGVMEDLQGQGMPHEEALAITAGVTQALKAQGMSTTDIDGHLGTQTFETSGTQDWLVDQARSVFGEDGAEFVGDVFTIDDFLSAGFGQSVTSLMLGDMSDEQKRVADMEKSAVQEGIMSIGTIWGDIPSMMAGFAVGGGIGAASGPGAVVTGMAGAFAMPEALRTILMDQYQNGTPANFNEAWDLFVETAEAGAKAWVTGAATGGVGVVAKPFLATHLPGTLIPSTIGTAAEVATFTMVGAALEGRVPEPSEFLTGAIAILGVKVSTKAAGFSAQKLRDVYKVVGKRPAEVAQDTSIEPSIRDDLASTNIDTPRAYGGGPDMSRRDFLNGSAAAVSVLATEGKVPVEKIPSERNSGGETKVVIMNEGGQGVNFDIFPASMNKLSGNKHEVVVLEGVRDVSEAVNLVQKASKNEAKLVITRGEGVLRIIDVTKKTEEEVNAIMEKATEEGLSIIRSGEMSAHLDLAGFSKTMKTLELDDMAPRVIEQLSDGRFTINIRTGELEALDSAGLHGVSSAMAKDAKEAERLAIEDNTVRTELAIENNKQKSDSSGDIIGDRISVGGKAPKEKKGFHELYTALFDDLHPLARVVNAITNGKALLAGADPYKLARNLKGVSGVGDAFLEFGVLDYASKSIIGPSLRSILRPIDKLGNLDAFRRYVVAKRVLELKLDREIETGVSLEAAKVYAEKNSAKFEEAAGQLREYQDALLVYVRDSGILSNEAYLAMKEANYDYVPFYRVMDKGTSTGSGLRSLNPIKGIKGSERKIIDPIESILRNSYVLTALAERQRVVGAMVELGAAHPDLIHKKKSTPQELKVAGDEIARLLEPYIKKNMRKALSEEELTVFRSRTLLSNGDLIYFRDGKAEIYEVNKQLQEAFGAMDREQLNIAIRILAIPASTLRTGAILTPEFMSRNILRDTLSAFVYSKDGFIPLIDTFRGMGMILKRDDAWKDWVISGGMFAHLQSVDRNYHQQGMKEMLTSIPMRNVLKNPIEILRAMSALAEQGTRVAVFERRSRKANKKEGKGRLDAITEAGFESRDVTLDFQRFGTKTRSLNQISAFFNAWVQGHDKLVRNFVNHPVAMSAKVMAGITIPSIALHLINRDEKWYQELASWERDIYWHVEIDGTIWKVPKPFELGVIFGTGAERAVEFLMGDNPDAGEEMLNTFGSLALPNMLPTAMAVPFEIWSNKSIFFGTPVIPRDREGMLGEYQYGIYTSQTAKEIGALIGSIPGFETSKMASPSVVEHAVRGWTGGLGKHTLDLIDKALAAAGVKSDAVKADPQHLTDVPLVKAFVVRHPTMNTSTIEKFFKEYDKREVLANTYKKLFKEGRVVEALAVFKNAAEQYNIMQLSGQKDAIGKLSLAIRKIHRLPSVEGMTDKELGHWKREQIDKNYIMINQIAEMGLKIVEAMDGNKKVRVLKGPDVDLPIWTGK